MIDCIATLYCYIQIRLCMYWPNGAECAIDSMHGLRDVDSLDIAPGAQHS